MAQKKSFKADLNPALQFISTPPEEKIEETTTPAPVGYKINPLYIEKRSKRLQLLIQPSLYERILEQKPAESSVNDYIHKILEQAVEE